MLRSLLTLLLVASAVHAEDVTWSFATAKTSDLTKYVAAPVPYAVLHAHCSRGGSGALYVGVPAKDAKGVFSVLPADNSFGLAVGVYDCGPNNSIMKRAVAVAPVPFGQGVKSPTTPTIRAPSVGVRSSSSNASPATGTSTFIGVQRVTVGGTNKIAGIFYGSYCPSGNCPR